MNIYMVKTVTTDDGSVNWFFVAAQDRAEVLEYCEDDVTKVLDIVDNLADMAQEVRREFDSVALVRNV